jgi:ABC-type branched-subunit amino acid transport system substrate-binding protein
MKATYQTLKTFAFFMAIILSMSWPSWAENGVTDDMILIGQACALAGPAAALGTELKSGGDAYLKKVNDAGGVHGRKIKVISYDDGYEPDLCIIQTRKLIDEDKVFSLFGYVGTPTAKAAVPVMDEARIPLVGIFTGAGFLREPEHLIFNIRGTYDQETGDLVKSFHQDLGLKKIACLYQNDAFGKVGLSGVEKGLAAEGLPLLGTATYERNTIAVKGAVAEMKKLEPEAIIMIGTYQPLAEFVKLCKQVGMENVKFATISFVGTAKYIEALGEAGEGAFISQVVPSPADQSVPIVKECTEVLGRQPTYSEMEGCLNAKVMVEGFKNAGRELTRQSFVAAMEGLTDYDAGGVKVQFGPGDHQGMPGIFFTKVQGGKAVTIQKLSD